ncbi:MAG: hypothetical protein ACOVON_00575 [Sediminibacterium sp.]
MKKTIKLALLALLSLGIQKANAQTEFMQSVGLTPYTFSNSNESGSGYGFTYSPRLNFLEVATDVNLSVGSHLSGGFSLNSRTGGSALVDIPLTCELNLGHAANSDASSNFGGFIGGGIGYNYMAYEDTWGGGSASTAGIYLDGGIKAYVFERSLGLRFSYLKAFSGANNVIGIGVMYNIGDF